MVKNEIEEFEREKDNKLLMELLKRLSLLQLGACSILISFLFIMQMIDSYLFYGGLIGVIIGGFVLIYLALKDLNKVAEELT